jgi:hypothetical protein
MADWLLPVSLKKKKDLCFKQLSIPINQLKIKSFSKQYDSLLFPLANPSFLG